MLFNLTVHTLKALNDLFQFFLGTVCGNKRKLYCKRRIKKDGTKFKVSWQTYLKGRGHGDYCHNLVKIAKQHFNLLANINGPAALRRRRRVNLVVVLSRVLEGILCQARVTTPILLIVKVWLKWLKKQTWSHSGRFLVCK